MDCPIHLDDNPLIAGELEPVPTASAEDLSWAVVKMRAVERIIVNELLIAAYQAASSPHSICALKSDLEAFDAWCRRHNRIALPTTPETVADYLDARAEQGSRGANPLRSAATRRRLPRSTCCLI